LPMVDYKTDRGTVGKATMPGSMEEKQELFDRGDLVGKWVHLEYSQWTKDDIPFHPTATAILDSKDELK